MPQLLKSMDGKKTKVVKATENMLLLPGGEEEHDHEGGEEHHHEYDPHVWLSPQRAIKMVETIRDQLVQQYPDKKASFTANADAYSEPSATRLSELTEYIKKNDIKVIYFEENASKSLSKTLSAETGVDLAVLNPLESLTDEQMKDGEDYISIMGANLKSLELTTIQAGKEIAPEEEEDTKTVANGYFEDSAIKDRTLSDYVGDWQSVYPYLKDGTLDQVFDYKAKLTKSKTVEEYKAYYTTGYKTDVDRIVITDKTMTFYKNGEEKKFEYRYAGKHTLNYTKGNRGVRYLFEATDPNAGEFKYVQFSDHQIAPNKAAHFHIFFGGESQEALYKELENWPTYYPSDLSGFEIAQEMLAH